MSYHTIGAVSEEFRALRNDFHIPCFCHMRQVMCYEYGTILVWKLPLIANMFVIKRAFPTWKCSLKSHFFPNVDTLGLSHALFTLELLCFVFTQENPNSSPFSFAFNSWYTIVFWQLILKIWTAVWSSCWSHQNRDHLGVDHKD